MDVAAHLDFGEKRVPKGERDGAQSAEDSHQVVDLVTRKAVADFASVQLVACKGKAKGP